MMMSESQRLNLRKHGTLVGRVLMGLLFFLSGLGIIMSGSEGIQGVTGMIASTGIPLAGIITWIVIAIKLVGGAGLMLGYRAGLSATFLILFTGLTVVFFHMDTNDPNLFKNLAIIGGLLYVMAYGPGEGWKMKAN